MVRTDSEVTGLGKRLISPSAGAMAVAVGKEISVLNTLLVMIGGFRSNTIAALLFTTVKSGKPKVGQIRKATKP